MTEVKTDSFERLIRDAGQGWLIDWHAPKHQALPHLRAMLANANDRAVARLGGRAPILTPESLIAAYQRNPHKVRAFLQVTASITTPDILVMVWRILQGMNVSKLTVEYQSEQRFKMSVELSPLNDSDGEQESYESEKIEDAVILRHFGIMKRDGAPIFDGFFPLNLQDQKT
jgi:hypothetical protein